MYKHTKPLIPVAFIAVISWIGIPATAADVMHARVSFDAGGTLVRGTEDSDWSHATLNSIILPGDTLWVTEGGTTELEMAGGTFLRMADASKVELTALPPDAALRAWTGSIYIQRLSRSTGTLMIETPACKIEVPKDAAVRIDMVEQGSTTVSVHWGQVTVRTDGDAPQTLAERQRVYVDPGLLPSAPMPFDVGSRDDFDIWNSDRAKILATGETRATTPIPATETTLGVSDLNTYGEWVVVENRQYWRPTVVADYIPYRYGHWSFVYGTGYCWVDSYPFAYVTSHYGRWSYFPSYGWCWGYDPVWSPAWVATVRYGPNFCWTPVDFYNRPVVVGAGATFNIGGVAFSFGASTFVPQTQLFYGANYVAPLQPAVIQNIDQTNINIWNININTDRPLVKVPYTDTKLAVFKESPKTILRGPEKLAESATTASEAVATLEKTKGVPESIMMAKKGPSTAQTPVEPKAVEAKVRKTSIEPDQRKIEVKAPAEAAKEVKQVKAAEEPKAEPGVATQEPAMTPGAKPEKGKEATAAQPPAEKEAAPGTPTAKIDKGKPQAVREPGKAEATAPERGKTETGKRTEPGKGITKEQTRAPAEAPGAAKEPQMAPGSKPEKGKQRTTAPQAEPRKSETGKPSEPGKGAMRERTQAPAESPGAPKASEMMPRGGKPEQGKERTSVQAPPKTEAAPERSTARVEKGRTETFREPRKTEAPQAAPRKSESGRRMESGPAPVREKAEAPSGPPQPHGHAGRLPSSPSTQRKIEGPALQKSPEMPISKGRPSGDKGTAPRPDQGKGKAHGRG